MTDRNRIRPLECLVWALTVAAAVALGCGSPDGHVIRFGDGQTELRLVDHISDAAVRSPLLEVEPVHSIGDIAAVEPSRRIDGELVPELTHGCRSSGDDADERGLGCRGAPITAVWDVPVTANSYSRIRMKIMTDDAGCFEVSVLNGRHEEIFLELDDRSPKSWQDVSTTIVASPTLRMAPRVRVRSRPGRTGCAIRISGVEGEEFDLGVAGELGILKAQAPLPGSDPQLGLAKVGLMMPTTLTGRVEPPYEDNFTISESILAPAPSALTFRIDVPDRARLNFRYGPYRGSRLGDTVGFAVSASRPGREPMTLWEDTVTVRDDSWYWREAAIDLGRFEHMTIDLTLQGSAPAGGRGYAVWGEPTITIPRVRGTPPNVIVIAVDTLRADRLSCYGYPDPVSPNIDALARDGTLFRNSFAQSNWTGSSFASIFSGLSVEAHGLVSLLDVVPASVTTLAERLREVGWSTHGIAYKPALAARGFEQGFETYFNVPTPVHSARENLRKAVEFLDRYQDQRFFLFLHFDDPHLPYTHPDPFFSTQSHMDIEYFDMPRPVWIYSDLRNCSKCGEVGKRASRFDRMARRMYVEEIQYLDDCIGSFVEELRRRDLYEDSVIVFVSDHGETLWDHYDQFDHGRENHHDELIHVPLMIKPHRGWGGAAGSVVDAQVRAFDLMPTILELAGIDPSDLDLEAETLVPMLRRPHANWPPRLVVSTNEDASAVRTASWRYVRPLLPHGGSERLFDLEADPGEHSDVAGDHPEVLGDLRLTAAEHILLRHPGVFVVVTHNRGDASVQMHWDGPAELMPTGHAGLRLTDNVGDGKVRFTDTDFVFSGAVENDPLALLAGYLVAEGTPVDVVVDDGAEVRIEDFPAYTAGELRRILEGRQIGVFAFTSPAPPHRALAGGTARETRVDSQQMEALRALGYVTE